MGDKSIASKASTKIHLFWESFTKAESNSYERSAWLDLFLAESLWELHGGKTPAEIISLSSNNIGNVLANEIVADIKNICTLRSEDDDFKPIQKHFLCGRGWRSIALLHALGVQDVLCAAELTNLLTSVYAVDDGHTDSVNPFVVHKTAPDIEQVCKFRLISKVKLRLFSISNGIDGSSPGPSRKVSSSSHCKRERRQEEKVKSTTDSETVEPEPHRAHSLKLWVDPMDLEYCTSVRSDDELKRNLSCQAAFFRKKIKKLVPDDFKDEKITTVLKEEMSSYQFRVLVVEILEGFCQMEKPRNNLTIACFNFALEQLCSLQFSTVANASKQINELKGGMTRLFLTALDKVLLQEDATNSIVTKGALPIMLRLLEDGIIKAHNSKKYNALLQDFIFGMMYAVINLIHSLLLQNQNPEKIPIFFPYFQQFLHSFNGRIIDKTIFCMIQDNSEGWDTLNRVKKIIELLSELILTFKQIRTKFVHLRTCKKAKHKGCRYALVSHHHDNIFGKVFTNNLLPSSHLNVQSCAITSLFMIFTRFLSEQAGREITIKTMQAMMQCGTCCCFPAPTLVSRILKVIQQSDTKVKNLGLLLLEKTIYREVGAIDLVTMCQVCLNVEEKEDKSFADLTKHRWTCLEAFQDMLLSSNYNITYTIGSHLMRITPRCSIQVKREILFGVFYPVFLKTKRQYESNKTEKERLTTTICLLAFTNLLGRMRFADEFVHRNGMVHILDLVKDRNFTNHCCIIIEMIIIICVWKLEKQNIADMLEENLLEIQPLLDFVLKCTTEYLNLVRKTEVYTRKENCTEIIFPKETDIDNYNKILEKLGFFWKSWMNLCLYCPQIRAFFDRRLSMTCHTLLLPFLQFISKRIKKKEEGRTDFNDKIHLCNQLHLKLLESLIILSVICPYSGNPGGILGLKTKLEEVIEGELGLKQICDVFIRSSGANPSKKILVPIHPMPKLDLEFGLANALEDVNSDSSLENSADEGYDADIDLPCQTLQEKNNASVKGSLPPSRRISSLHYDRRYCTIAHPSLWHLVIHLIVTYYKDKKWSKECVHSIYKLSSCLRDNPENSVKLSKSGFNKELILKFSDLLISDENKNIEMQSAVLDLFGHLAKYNIDSSELTLFIRLFTADKPPLKMLLPCLLKLLSGIVQQPKYILCFPAAYSNTNLVNSTNAHKLSISMHQNHVLSGMHNSWTRSALFLPINTELGWAMWVQGFSISLWLRLEANLPSESMEPNDGYTESTSSESGRSSGLDEFDVNQLLHIISIGYEAHVLEFWADTSRELLYIRLTRPDGAKQEVVSEVSLEGRLTSNAWHHLAISVRDSVHNSRVVIEVLLIIDGWCEMQVPLIFKGILIRKTKPTSLMIGDTRFGVEEGLKVGRWQLGGLIMFRKPVLNKKTSIWLTALGPDCYNMTHCRVGNVEPAWHSVFNPKTMTVGIPWNDLLKKKDIIKELQEAVLLSYCSKSPDVINLYPMASASSSGLGGGFRVIGMEQRSSQLVPMSVPIVMYCTPILQNYSALTSAIDNLGGISVFVILFARVVELGGNELEQAQALELLLRLCHSQPHLKSESFSYLPLMRHVIETDLCKPGPHMLKAILDTCCDKPGLITVLADKHQVTTHGDFILTEPFVVTKLIIGPAKFWMPCLSMFLDALLYILRDDHPYREFNSNQLNRAEALDALLYFCKERLVEDIGKLDSSVCASLVEVIRGLMTAPPQLHHLTVLADYLLLAQASYISFARSSLYFVLPPRPPSKYKKTNKSIHLIDRQDVNEYKVLFTQPVDPGQLENAVNNIQLRQSGTQGVNSVGKVRIKEIINNRKVPSFTDIQPKETARNKSNHSNCILNNRNANYTSEDSSSTEEEDNKCKEHIFTQEENAPVDVKEGDDITVGLLSILRDQIVVSPDNMAHTALQNILIPESFIAMVNKNNTNITTAVVRVLSVYLERTNSEEKNRFIKFRGFHLLAMQLSYVIPTADLADALAGIVTRTHWLTLKQQVEADINDFYLPGLPPLLSILPKSVTHVTLSHDITVFLHHLFLKIGEWKNILEYGLVEVLLKTLVCVIHQYDLSNTQDSNPNLIITDINNSFSSIGQHAIQTSGSNNMQIYADVIMQIEYVYGLENKSCGDGSKCCVVIKQLHCSYIQSSLKYIVDAVSMHSRRSYFFSSVMTFNNDDNESYNSSSSCNVTQLASKLSKSELHDRFKTIISKAAELVVYTEPVNDENIVKGEEMRRVSEFAKEVWLFILQSLVTIIERKSMSTRSSWSNVIWAVRETVRTLGSQMFVWLLSPSHSKDLKMFLVQTLVNEARAKDVLVYIISNAQLEKTVALYLWDLRHCVTDMLDSDIQMCDDIIFKIEEWCGNSVLGIINGSPNDKSAELIMECVQQSFERYTWNTPHITQIHKVVFRHETLIMELTERTFGVSKEVDTVQGHQKKLHLETIKAGMGAKVLTVFKWKEIISNLTHERAVWHFPNTYPQSWELDRTEGPGRVRIRLRRCHLKMDERYFKKEFIVNSRKEVKQPFSFIFEGALSTSSALIDRLHSNTKIRHTCQASVISPDLVLPGELLIGHCSLYFVPGSDGNTMEWAFSEIKELHKRRFELQDRALELFLTNGKTYLIAFETFKDRDSFIAVLHECDLGNRMANEQLSTAVQMWCEGLITNWEYLIILNTLSGRSYNDLMQYPVLPFILSDYMSDVLDLTNPKTFRNLMKPIAIQEKQNEAHYINNYNYLLNEINNDEPYHYSSHYSNSGIVLHFLVRLPPFTNMFLNYQDNNFDWPDRTFHSLNTTWRLTSSESVTDVKELIPEFFFLPEFLLNLEGFNFGTMQNGQIVDDVILPPWAKDARLFILIHRQALESENVKEYMPHWIDLVFGYKQTGKEAVNSINVFPPATYFGFDPESINDPIACSARKSMVRLYGQTPKQLFDHPHPMVVKNLTPTPTAPPVLQSVKGLKWGHYVGSPADSPPIMVSQRNHYYPITTLVAMLSNDVFGLAANSTLLLSYIKETSTLTANKGPSTVFGAALITWCHGDGIIRAKLTKDQVPFPAIGAYGESILFCTSIPDCNQLWVVYLSGKINVYKYYFDNTGKSVEFDEVPVTLVGHKDMISNVAISRLFSIAVSASHDGSASIWDINTLTYIRSLPVISIPITLVSISETLGDIATVGQDPGGGSILRLHSINAKLIGSLTTEDKITAITISSAPEGLSVNVIATGMIDGVIRLWSTWDLTPVGIITAPVLVQPIICLSYSQDSQHLYASTAEGLVVIWQGSSLKSAAVVPRFLNLQ
ncbi:lysosomal-trafficking regulator isoform X2 [Cimex lectularius]|uniref:Lysosomal-trafficking regulator n=1 Tax=Cimex lectularius TaxID=79782 RepID=A0A8I6RY03_CIMLE|nr:lysosomal-trafficking regulator isoform X2 [Cimex lectularius]